MTLVAVGTDTPGSAFAPFCTECGTKSDVGDKFCFACGTALRLVDPGTAQTRRLPSARLRSVGLPPAGTAHS